jgi:ComF family protein
MFSPVNFILNRRRLHPHWRPLWPVHCLVCRGPCANETQVPGEGLCPACRATLPWNRSACARCALPTPVPTSACGRCLRRPPPLTETRAAFVYGPPLDRLLPRLKFHDDLAAGRLLAGLMAESMHPNPGDTHATLKPMALIPLPLHRHRLRSRGYDQALELARPLAKRLDLPLRTDLLLRTRDTAAQSRLDAPARRKNMRGAFRVNVIALKRHDPPPAHIVLVDDVMTTGATLHAAADALLRAGVMRVDAWVCARVA